LYIWKTLTIDSKGPLIGNGIWGIKWSGHVTDDVT